jgi:hypothetical protein
MYDCSCIYFLFTISDTFGLMMAALCSWNMLLLGIASLSLHVLQAQRGFQTLKNMKIYIDAISLNLIFQKITYLMQYMRHCVCMHCHGHCCDYFCQQIKYVDIRCGICIVAKLGREPNLRSAVWYCKLISSISKSEVCFKVRNDRQLTGSVLLNVISLLTCDSSGSRRHSWYISIVTSIETVCLMTWIV